MSATTATATLLSLGYSFGNAYAAGWPDDASAFAERWSALGWDSQEVILECPPDSSAYSPGQHLHAFITGEDIDRIRAADFWEVVAPEADDETLSDPDFLRGFVAGACLEPLAIGASPAGFTTDGRHFPEEEREAIRDDLESRGLPTGTSDVRKAARALAGAGQVVLARLPALAEIGPELAARLEADGAAIRRLAATYPEDARGHFAAMLTRLGDELGDRLVFPGPATS